MYKKLTGTAKLLIKKYKRILIRGKKNRTVALLLDYDMIKCIKLILKLRKKAKVGSNNPHVFGLPGTQLNPDKHAEACVEMGKFSVECGASKPELLRGTLLRKHIATECISLNLSNTEIKDLANFMGHDESIHFSHYRQQIASRDIINVSKLLERAQGISYMPDGKICEDTDDEDEEINSNKECRESVNLSTCSTSSNEQQGKGKKVQKRKHEEGHSRGERLPKNRKTAWTTEETQAVLDKFRTTKPVNATEIRNLISSTLCLKHRSEAQIRTFVHNQRKKK